MHKLIFFLLLFSIACNTSKNIPTPEIISRGESTGEDILFIIYQINRTEDIPSATMENGLLKPGKLKEDLQSNASSSDKDIFIIETLNESQEVMGAYYFSNPLLEKVEYVKDSQGNLAVKEIEHQKKELVARMNVDSSISKLQLYYKNSDTSKKNLIHSIIIQ